jgi:hypothetical protein
MCTRFREYFPHGPFHREHLALCHHANYRHPVRREVGYDYVGLCDRCRRPLLGLEPGYYLERVYRPRYR